MWRPMLIKSLEALRSLEGWPWGISWYFFLFMAYSQFKEFISHHWLTISDCFLPSCSAGRATEGDSGSKWGRHDHRRNHRGFPESFLQKDGSAFCCYGPSSLSSGKNQTIAFMNSIVSCVFLLLYNQTIAIDLSRTKNPLSGNP